MSEGNAVDGDNPQEIPMEQCSFPNIASNKKDDFVEDTEESYDVLEEERHVDNFRNISNFSNSSFARRRVSMTTFFKSNASRPLNKRSRHENIFAVCAGVCLSFNSGFINGSCMSGLLTESGSTLQSVAGFTGTYTKAGLGLAEGDFSFFGFEMSMISSFIAGSCISALINPKPVPHQVGPTYGPTFLLGSVLLAIASILSSTHPEQKNLFYFAAAANGLQNGMTSMYSANLIRTTHLTGTSTDIGLFLGQVLRGNYANAWKLGVLTSLAISFWLGSFISFFAVTRFRGYTLIFNAGLFFLIGVCSIIFVAVVQNVTIWQAASGRWHWQKALNALNVTLSGREDANGSRVNYMDVFDRMDVDRDGTIDADELYLGLKASGMHISKRGAQSLIAAANGENDGKISRDEWEKTVLESRGHDAA